MSVINWLNAINGNFSTAADWTGGLVPGAADTANLAADGGASYTVTEDLNTTVSALETAANATLAINPNLQFQMTNGTGAGANAGQIQVGNNSILFLGGTFNNTSTVSGGGLVINGAANNTELRLIGPSTTFTGAGTVSMIGTNDYIFGNNGAANTLVNVNDTFSGAGNLGDGSMTMINEAAGVVNANATAGMTLQVNGGVINDGTLEATNTGGLFILNTGVDDEGAGNTGKVLATGAGAHVDLQNSGIAGGTITTGAGAFVDVVQSQRAYLYGADPGAPVNITAGSNVDINNNAILDLYGTIANAGTINIDAAANNTEIRLDDPVVSLTGGGAVVMTGTTANDYIFGNNGAYETLDNVNNTISGGGNLGNGDMTFVNEGAGVVNANQSGGMTLDANGGVTNKGLMEATSTGGLFILNTGVDQTQSFGTVANAGVIEANGAGTHVDLQNSTISGGTLTTLGTGAVIDVVQSQPATFDGTAPGAPVNVSAGSNVLVNNNATLNLAGQIDVSGTLTLGVDGEPNNTLIRLGTPTVTLSNIGTLTSGVLQMSDSSNNYIFATNGYQETLVNNIKIQGAGDIGNGDLTLNNTAKGKIIANSLGGTVGSESGVLTINPNGGVTNAGLMESALNGTKAGDLFILNTTINQNSGGKLEATGSATLGTEVDLQNAVISGGTLTSSTGPSFIDVVAGQSATLDGSGAKGLTNSAKFNVNNNSTVYLDGMINNSKGSINLLSGANASEIRLNGAVTTLTGSGKVTMGDTVTGGTPNGNSLIIANQGFQQLVNVNNTITGSGNIGDGGSLQLVNQTKGIVNGNATVALALNENVQVLNTGLLESSTTVAGAGGLFIVNTNVNNTGNANAGKITATGTGHVDLQNSNIYGGTLTTSTGGVIDVVGSQAAGLYGSEGNALNIAAGSSVVSNNNSTLFLGNTISNAGTISVEAAANNTDIQVAQPVLTLTGGGHVVLSTTGGGTAFLYSNSGSTELDNVNNTISGTGDIGNGGDLLIDNETAGMIDATTGGLTINSQYQVVNAGLIETTTGNLVMNSGSGNVFNTGAISVAAGTSVTISGDVNGTGTMTINGSGHLEIASSYNGASAQAVSFASGATGTFRIDQGQYFNGSIAGLSAGGANQGVIDLGAIGTSLNSLTWVQNGGSGTLTVNGSTTTAVITLVGTYSQANFTAVSDGSNGLDIQYNAIAAASRNIGGATTGQGGASSFAGAMASLGATGSTTSAHAVSSWRPMLSQLAAHA